jgi:hypothetical protein
MEIINQLLASAVIASALTGLAGCVGVASESAVTRGPGAAISQTADKPIPRVQDCGVLNTGTPSRFVCDGKVYTSFQLAKLREDEARKYAPGK